MTEEEEVVREVLSLRWSCRDLVEAAVQTGRLDVQSQGSAGLRGRDRLTYMTETEPVDRKKQGGMLG